MSRTLYFWYQAKSLPRRSCSCRDVLVIDECTSQTTKQKVYREVLVVVAETFLWLHRRGGKKPFSKNLSAQFKDTIDEFNFEGIRLGIGIILPINFPVSQEILSLILKLWNNFHIILFLSRSNTLADLSKIFSGSCYPLPHRWSCAHCYNCIQQIQLSLTQTVSALFTTIMAVSTNGRPRYMWPYRVLEDSFLNSNGYAHNP